MANTVLCAIDLSPSSKQALEWAVRMAQQLKVHLTVLYTYRLIQANGEAVRMKKELEEEAQKKFAILEKELLAGKGITYDFSTEVGFVSDRIEDHAKKHKLNFVVMDKKISMAGTESFQELMDHIQVPLLLVP